MDLPATDDLNALSEEGFVEALAPLFEGAPRFVRRRPWLAHLGMLPGQVDVVDGPGRRAAVRQ